MLASCAVVDLPVEVGKTVWGSSTRVLEKARKTAITKTYDKGYWDCIRASLEVVEKEGMTIFRKDEIKGHLIVVGIKGAVNTTEVGVFFDEISENQTRIDISSLSTHAKRLLAKKLLHGLDIAFGLVPPDPIEVVEDKEALGKSDK